MNIRRALQKPQQLGHDIAKIHLLGRDERKTGAQIILGLHAEHRNRVRARAVSAQFAVIEDVLPKVEVLTHKVGVKDRWPAVQSKGACFYCTGNEASRQFGSLAKQKPPKGGF